MAMLPLSRLWSTDPRIMVATNLLKVATLWIRSASGTSSQMRRRSAWGIESWALASWFQRRSTCL